MSWKEQPKMSRIAFLVGMACFFASIALTVLNMMGVLAGLDWLKDILDCGFWLSIGVAFVKKELLFSIISFALAGLFLYFFFLNFK